MSDCVNYAKGHRPYPYSKEPFQALELVSAKVWFRKNLLSELRETRGREGPQECAIGVRISGKGDG